MSDEEVANWDQWFAGTGDETSIRAWEVAKTVGERSTWIGWAHIIECNRLQTIYRNAPWAVPL